MNFNPQEHRIFEAVTGSRLYGTATETSDWDYRGVVIPPLEVLIDPFMKFNVQDSGFEEEDKALYSLGKFFELCAQANPNIIELLFIPQEYTTFDSEEWQIIKENRSLFVSKKVKYTFTGYAMSQLKAIQRHREWFLNPPKDAPNRKDFGLSDSPSVSMAWIDSLKDTLNYDLLRPEVVDEVRREKEYRDAKKKWDNFIQWKTNRNPKRRGTEEQFGYDTKYASHVFRLMGEGLDLLMDGEITFPLPYADWLLEIKQGKYSYDEIVNVAETMDKNFESFYNKSFLPKSPDISGLKDLYYSLVIK